jgi:hypothetical protein
MSLEERSKIITYFYVSGGKLKRVKTTEKKLIAAGELYLDKTLELWNNKL